MPKIVQYNLPPGGTVVQLADDLTTALEIEGVDSTDYVVVKTSEGSESLTLSAGGAGVQINESGQTKSTASGGWFLIASDPTDTVPNIMPSSSDPDTGIGHSGGTSDSDALSLIAGGVEGIRITEAITHATGSIQSAVVKINDAIQYNAGTGTDTATTEPVYLADTNATLTIDFANGNFGDVTLAASITTIKFLNAPVDGTVATVTAKFTKSADATARTIDYSASAAAVYSEDGDSEVTGEVLWSGGVAHTMSTGNASVDVVSFTCIPSGSTFNIYAAVIGQDFA